MLIYLLVFVCWMIAIVAIVMIAKYVLVIRRSHERLDDASSTYTTEEALDYSKDESGALRQWLYRAGFRGREAPVIFILACVGFFALGLVAIAVFFFTSLSVLITNSVLNMPGNAGEIFIIPVLLMPFLFFAFLATTPIFYVMSVRKTRVRRIEQGMPIVMELLATLGESGLSLDASIDRILKSWRRDHPLSAELQIYQADIRSGRHRVECLRRMAARIDIISFTAFISAVVLADQRGASVADALRRQAEELRKRRRERAMEIALTAPVKRVVPMVVFFLPAIFVFTLGPIYFNYFRVFEALILQTGTTP